MGREAKAVISHEGRTKTIRDWSLETGIFPDTIRQRLRKGWPVAQVLGFKQRAPRPRTQERTITVRVSREQYKAIGKAAHRHEVSMNKFCADAILARVSTGIREGAA